MASPSSMLRWGPCKMGSTKYSGRSPRPATDWMRSSSSRSGRPLPRGAGPCGRPTYRGQIRPQLELLQRASLTITHAGLNTTLESLSQGVPMVAIPVGNDQPGVASRIAWTGTGEVVPFRKVSSTRLRAAIEKVLSTPAYRAAALRMRESIREADGLNRAATVIENALKIG